MFCHSNLTGPRAKFVLAKPGGQANVPFLHMLVWAFLCIVFNVTNLWQMNSIGAVSSKALHALLSCYPQRKKSD